MDSRRPLLDQLIAGGDLDAEAFFALVAERLSWLDRLDGTPQNPRWHAEGDVGIHTRWVVREAFACPAANALPPRERWLVRFGALLHDIGKVSTTRWATVDGEAQWVSFGHPYAGYSYLAPRMARISSDPSWGDRLLALVRYHHHPKRLVSENPVPKGMAYLLARVAGMRALELVEGADVRGRTSEGKPWQLEQMALFKLYAEDFGLYGEHPPYRQWAAVLRARFDAPVAEAILWRTIRDVEAGRVFSLEEGIARHFALSERLVTVHVLSGPPASGKSTFVRRALAGIDVVSLDEIRRAEGRDANEGRVRQAALEALRASLRAGRDVVWDATNTQADVRRRIIGIARDYGALVRLYGFQVDPMSLRTRNAERQRQVPDAVIDRMSERYAFPDFDEADVVHVVDATGQSRILGDV